MVGRGDKKWYLKWNVWLIPIVVVIALYAAWFILMSYVECDSRDCFNTNLASCIRTKYTGGNNMIYEYIIINKAGSLCDVQVTLLQGELNNKDSQRLEGKNMVCQLPLGVIMNPESDIRNCHGDLKEGLQDLVIQKLYTYLVQNIGRINLEALELPGVAG